MVWKLRLCHILHSMHCIWLSYIIWLCRMIWLFFILRLFKLNLIDSSAHLKALCCFRAAILCCCPVSCYLYKAQCPRCCSHFLAWDAMGCAGTVRIFFRGLHWYVCTLVSLIRVLTSSLRLFWRQPFQVQMAWIYHILLSVQRDACSKQLEKTSWVSETSNNCAEHWHHRNESRNICPCNKGEKQKVWVSSCMSSSSAKQLDPCLHQAH